MLSLARMYLGRDNWKGVGRQRPSLRDQMRQRPERGRRLLMWIGPWFVSRTKSLDGKKYGWRNCLMGHTVVILSTIYRASESLKDFRCDRNVIGHNSVSQKDLMQKSDALMQKQIPAFMTPYLYKICTYHIIALRDGTRRQLRRTTQSRLSPMAVS